jgi:hypothetical protein
MASTIQLKTGTGSAVPSSLTQGELAINIDNGLIYYGSGSGNTRKQLESFTNITASGNISASGDIITTKLRDSVGNNHIVFGNNNNTIAISSDDGEIMTLDGDSQRVGINKTTPGEALEVVGNISASGNIITTKAFVREGAGGGIIFDDDGDETAEASITHTGGGINLYANGSNPTSATHLFVTQSGGTGMAHGKVGIGTMTPDEQLEVVGNISASGNIYANEFYADLGSNYGYHIGSGKPTLSMTDGGTLNLGAPHPTYIAAGVNIYTTGSDSSKGLFLDSTGNITASGNISSSGNIFGNGIHASGDSSADGFYIDSGGAKPTLWINPSINTINVGGAHPSYTAKGFNVYTTGSDSTKGLFIDGLGNITASGNISASGYIYGRQFEQLASGSNLNN